MKRPMLVSGITIASMCFVLTALPKCAVVILALGVLVLFLSIIIKGLRKHIIIPTCAIFIIISALSFTGFYHTKIEPCINHHNKTEYIQGKVISSPIIAKENLVFTLKTEKIGNTRDKLKITVTVPYSDENDISLYDNIYISDAYLTIPLTESNDYDLKECADGTILNAKAYGTDFLSKSEKTPYYYCLYFKEQIKDKIALSMSDNNGALLTGMLFGEKSDLDSETAKAFRNSGISHLLAVSGLHTSLWCGLLISFLKLLKCKEGIRNLICVIFLTCFCIISGFTPSVVRASIMTAVTLLAPIFRRTPDSLNSLGIAITVLLIANPYTIHSISFQLSVLATAGVLFSDKAVNYLSNTITRDREKHLKAIGNYLISSVIISLFAGIFTLPASAYHFGVFSILSPISNILCVKPGFYGMISGTLGILLSSVPVSAIKSIGFTLFDITEFIFDIVIAVASGISKISFCTVPVYTNWFIPALCIVLISVALCYLITDRTHSKIPLAVTSVICSAALLVSIITPLVATKYRNTITVISANNNIHLVIRSGTHYAYICNTITKAPVTTYDYLPSATAESLDYYIVTYTASSALSDIELFEKQFSPEETRITKLVHSLCFTNQITLPANTIIKTNGKYELTDEISFEIIDTTPVHYVIIKGPEKTAYIHLHGDTAIEKATDISQGDIFVYKGSAPQTVPHSAETIVLSADTQITADKSIKYIERICEDLHITARDGSITLNI